MRRKYLTKKVKLSVPFSIFTRFCLSLSKYLDYLCRRKSKTLNNHEENQRGKAADEG